MKRLLLLCALARCSCDPRLVSDAGYACTSDRDCAAGFHCIAGVCAMGDAGGGTGGGFVEGSISGGLAFLTPARSAVAGNCSQPLSFELRDDAGVTQAAPFDVAVQMSSAPTMSFYSDNACSTATTFVTVPQGQSSGTFHFVGTLSGVFVVTLSAPPLDSAGQPQNIVPPGMDSVVFTSAQPATVLAGTCVGPLTVQVQDPAGVPQVAGVDGVSLDLTLSPAGLTAFTDDGCTQVAGATLNIVPGQSSSTFWVNTATAASYTVQVGGAGFISGQQMVVFAPIVHSGSCDLVAPNTIRNCTVSPPQLDFNRTFFLYQATGGETLAERVESTCVLSDESHIQCARAGNVGDVSIIWKTVELPGAHVDRYTVLCPADGGLTETVALDASVPASSVFTLLDANTHGSDPNANDFFTVRNDGTQLSFKWEQQCLFDNLRLQVVQSPWANVVHASGMLPPAVAVDTQGAMPIDGGFFVLATWRTDAALNITSVLCDRVVRPSAPMSNRLQVSRGAGRSAADAGCTDTSITGYELERVDFGPHATTQQLLVSMDAGVTVKSVPIQAVDLTRAYVLASGQSGGMGQGVGEAALVHLGDGGSPLGEAGATFTFQDATHVQISRGTANDVAVFSVSVVEMEP